MTTWFYPGQEDYIAKLNDLAAIAALSTGPAGWSPRFGLVSDGERRVLQVQDWIGGGGTKPATGDYVGNTSYVSDISSAVDIRGSIGPSGLNGTDGVDGEPGPANELSIGTVTAGLTADASITGTSPSQVLNLVLPKGDKGDTGDKGDKGDKGDANVLTIGTVVSGETASASITGTSPAQVLNLVLPKGDKGDKGDAGTNGTDGIDGAAATITVGTVTTGAPGTSVQVTNSGTTNAAVFDFVIPKGDPGDGSGNVTGPASSTDNAFVVFDGTGGNVIKQGPAVVAAGATEEDARVAVKVDSSYSFRMSEVDRAAYIDDNGLLPELKIGYSNGNLILLDAEVGAPIQVDYVPWAGITNKPAVIAAGADAAAARYAISAAASTHSHSTSDVTGLGTELAALNDHIAGTGEFHAASIIQVTPVGGIAADNVQAALAELDSEKLADAPSNGVLHGRKDGAWEAIPTSSNYQTGDILTTSRVLAAPDWVECDKIYLKSSYPDLAALLGGVAGVVWTPATGNQTATPGINGTSAVRTATGAIICVGGAGGVWRSLDNGVNFTKITGPNTSDTLQAICVAKNTSGLSDVLVAVGNSGAVWRSTDDGLTFTKQTGPNTTDLLLGVAASGTVGGTIVAVGQSGVVWRSTNIGVSWSKITGPNTTDLLYNVLFLDGTNVIATIGSNAIWKSNNSGSSWTRASISASSSGQWPIRLNSNVLLSAAPTSRIARSADNGNTWVDTGYTAGNTSNCRAVVRLSDTEAFVVQSNGTIRHSVDEGQTWVQVDQPYYSAGAGAGIAISETEALIIGSNWSLIMDGSYYDSTTQFSTPRFRSEIAGAKRYIKT